jgi:hypothetical protein
MAARAHVIGIRQKRLADRTASRELTGRDTLRLYAV